MVPSLPLLSCEWAVSVKENPDRKKKDTSWFCFENALILKRYQQVFFILFLVYSISIKYIDLKCKQSYSTNTFLEYDYATLKVLVAEKLFPIFTSLQNSICQ